MPPGFARDIRRTLLEDTAIRRIRLLLRGSHPLRRGFPADLGSADLGVRGPTLHIPPPFREGVRFALYRVRSPLLTVSLLISFPAGTKMLQSPAFPVVPDHSEE